MIIQSDTREKAGKKDHILNYFAENGIKVVRSKCFVGDWTLVENHSVCVDTKTLGLQEVYSNLIGKEHERFRDECARAQTCEIKLIVLVEESGIKCLDDVEHWQNPRRTAWFRLNAAHKAGKCLNRVQSKQPPASSEALMKSMRTMSERYGVEWRFCEKANTGREIVRILEQEHA